MEERMRGLLLIAVVAALSLAGSASGQNPTLFATVGPGFSIRVADGAGNRITRIPPGTYTVNVNDLSSEHNFHLTGPGGLDMSTTVEGTGTATWTITFQAGSYHYQCDPHFNTMRGDIAVETGAPLPTPATTTTTTTTTTTPPPPLPPAPTPVRRLTASVGPSATIAVRIGLRKITALRAGRVVLTVRDRSAKDNFHLTGPGINRATSRPGRATVIWRLTLRRGLYVYRSDANPRLRGSFRAT
jgi:Copper binding proteins, plastocyanin/azurin family